LQFSCQDELQSGGIMVVGIEVALGIYIEISDLLRSVLESGMRSIRSENVHWDDQWVTDRLLESESSRGWVWMNHIPQIEWLIKSQRGGVRVE
jgi:hypothetical protein